jgi:arsenate reductase (thioredoxin)
VGKKILFICIKNASRSPMAAAMLKQSAVPGLEVHSAGITPGREVNRTADQAMHEIGIDISGHEPVHFSRFHHLQFDFVAKMDVPDLGDMIDAKWVENWDVPDPAKGGIDEYRKVREMLADRVARLVASLKT